MRESRLSGSVEGVVSDHDSYSDFPQENGCSRLRLRLPRLEQVVRIDKVVGETKQYFVPRNRWRIGFKPAGKNYNSPRSHTCAEGLGCDYPRRHGNAIGADRRQEMPIFYLGGKGSGSLIH
jgi:hypothetical protein